MYIYRLKSEPSQGLAPTEVGPRLLQLVYLPLVSPTPPQDTNLGKYQHQRRQAQTGADRRRQAQTAFAQTVHPNLDLRSPHRRVLFVSSTARYDVEIWAGDACGDGGGTT